MNLSYKITRLSLAIVFLYHGIVPKIIFGSAQEIEMNNFFMPFLSEKNALLISGVLEIIYAITLLVFFRSKLLLIPCYIFMLFVTPILIFKFPHFFTEAFNPFTLNFSILVLTILNHIHSSKDLR